jgi:hypothetical protein
VQWNRECVTCNKLGRCTETDAHKILSHYVCHRFEEVGPEVVHARCDTINKFGKAGLTALLEPDTTISEGI